MESTHTPINICISSNIGYVGHTYNTIIPSLLTAATPPQNIHIFVSGCSESKSYINEDGINVYETTYSSFEFTPFIKIIEEQIYSKYWLLLHDTCEIVNPNFFQFISEFPYNNVPSVALFNGTWACNMGAYEWDYLNKSKDRINAFRNTDTSSEKLSELKRSIISNEDFLLDKVSSYTQIKESVDITTEQGSTKVVDHFVGVGVKKVKTTWGWHNINTQYVL